MLDPDSKKPYILPTMQTILRQIVSLLIFCIWFLALVAGCEDKSSKPLSTTQPSGFTFLNLGADTRYSNAVRDRMRDQLGSDAVDTRTIIDLEINYPGFIEEYFPPIHQLHLSLTDARGARVEHDTIKLIYRYPQKKSRLFKTVQLLFSGQSKKPLFFHIIARKEGSGILETMREKYGEPKEISWTRQPGKSYYWQDRMDLLVVSRVIDRFGDPEYRIAIYYGANIDELIKYEQRQIQQREDRRKAAGQTAF